MTDIERETLEEWKREAAYYEQLAAEEAMTDIERAKELIAKLIRTEGGPYLDEHRAKDAATLAAALTAVRREQIERDAGIADKAAQETTDDGERATARHIAAALRAQLEEKG